MPSPPIFSRKFPFSRNGLWHDRGHSRQSSCTPRTRLRVLYGLIAILLTIVLLLAHRQLTISQLQGTSVGCGAVEDTLRSLIVLPAATKVVQLGGAQDTVYSGRLKNELISRSIGQKPLDGGIQTGERPKILAFVGIQTGFGSAERRRALRQTWMPSSREGIVRLEEETGLAFRFVIGYTSDTRMAAELEKEIEIYRDFVRIDNEEEYARLPFKTLAFFKAAYMLFDADFYVKADDDIYLRPDRLSLLLKRKRRTSRTYLGCMKKGSVITSNAFKWYEPLGYLLGNEYFYHAYGPIYALSRDVVADLSTFRNDSLRMFSNEDVTIGSWMLAFNVHHEDDRTLCQAECQVDSIAVWDIPNCSGLCKPEQKLFELHQQDMCSKSPAIPNG